MWWAVGKPHVRNSLNAQDSESNQPIKGSDISWLTGRCSQHRGCYQLLPSRSESCRPLPSARGQTRCQSLVCLLLSTTNSRYIAAARPLPRHSLLSAQRSISNQPISISLQTSSAVDVSHRSQRRAGRTPRLPRLPRPGPGRGKAGRWRRALPRHGGAAVQ